MDLVRFQDELQKKLHTQIPPTKTLEFRVETIDDHALCMSAPLQTNINDKGTAFGGSIASLCTITGWSLCWVLSKYLEVECDMVVYESSMNYYRPITKDFTAEVKVPCGAEIENIKAKLQEKNKASIELEVLINENMKECVKYVGKYAFLKKQ